MGNDNQQEIIGRYAYLSLCVLGQILKKDKSVGRTKKLIVVGGKYEF